MKRWLPAGAILALAAGMLLGDTRAPQGETEKLLEQIRQVGREGAGNVEAARAWKALVARGPEALLPILRALDDEDRKSANWLRPAFEAIAEKAVASGQLTKETLEKVIADRKLSGVARRIAYEWLVKLDKSTPDRLLPGMLHDPSPELRRDAVERVVNQAKEALNRKDTKTARQRYQEALAGAADPEQVEAIAAALGKLEVKVDLARQLGLVRRWHLIAPFEHSKGTGWNVAYPPEKGVDLTGSYKGKEGKIARWSAHTTPDPRGVVDLNKALGKMKGTVAYACAFLDSPNERPVDVRAGSANGLKIFLNGKEIFALEEYHHAMHIDQYRARGTLRKGTNVLLLKVCQNEQEEAWAQEWKFQVRLCEPVGVPVPFTEIPAPGKEEKP